MMNVWSTTFSQITKDNRCSERTLAHPFQRKQRSSPQLGRWHISFWNVKAILFIDYLQKGRSINREYSAKLLKQSQKAMKAQRPGKLIKWVLFYQDNYQPLKSVVTIAAVHDCGFTPLDYPPYLPDQAPSGYFLFPNIKSPYLWGITGQTRR